MPDFLADLRRSCLFLARTPMFACGAILTLALGMGGAITFFGAFYGAILRTPPYPRPDDLYQLQVMMGGQANETVSAICVREMAAACPSVEALGVYTTLWGRPTELEAGGAREPLKAAFVDSKVLPMLGAGMALGTPFLEGNYWTGEGVILTHRFWKKHLGGDPTIVGRMLPLTGKGEIVVGVLRADFELPFAVKASILRPLPPLRPGQRGEYRFMALCRLRPGTKPGVALEAFQAVAREQARQFPRNCMPDFIPTLRPLGQALAKSAGPEFLLVCGAAALLLVLAAANVAALFLNRASERTGEMAVRLSLGASRWQLLRHCLPEGLLVATAAAFLGFLFAMLTGDLIRAWIPGGETLHGLGRAWSHPAVTGFALALVLLLGLLMAVLQVLQVGGLNLERVLRAAGGQSRATHRVRDGLVVVQLALATFLLCTAGLMSRSLYRALTQPLGIATHGLQAVDLELKDVDKGPEGVNFSSLLQHLASRRGIRLAATARAIPTVWREGSLFLGGYSLQNGSEYRVNASTVPEALETSPESVFYDFVSEGYVETLGLRLLQGRTFTREDLREGRRVCMLDARAAQRFFPDGAIGRRLHFGIAAGALGMGEGMEVIGVLASFRAFAGEMPEVPFALLPAPFMPPMRLLVRSNLSMGDLRQEVEGALAAEFPAARVARTQDLDSIRWGQALWRRRLLSLVAAFGVLALLMAALGLGALVSSQVIQRTREYGIKAAIGATPGRILQGVLLSAAVRSVAGMTLGILGSMAFSKVLESVLYGVKVTDFLSLAGAAAVLFATSVLAALMPALRAARIQPGEALRSDG